MNKRILSCVLLSAGVAFSEVQPKFDLSGMVMVHAYADWNSDEEFQAANLEHLKQVPYYAWKFLVRNLLKIDNSNRLSSIKSDVQIIWGTKDAIFDKKSQETLQKGLDKAKSIEFHEIKDADHNTHWGSKAAVETVTNYIDNFIKGDK